MPQNPNKISQFWQELKRRKVVRVITVYAAAAFVILELVDIVSPSLRLPEWTMNFIIVLLCVGFIIIVIVSWVYDVTPEGGIVKTEPAHKVIAVEEHPSSNSWRIASYISFVVIVVLIILNILPRANPSKDDLFLGKSIAVLPFDDMSPEKDQEYFCDGMTEEIINALAHIEGLKVIARTSAFSFKGKDEDIREIGKKLDVETLLEGSIRKDGKRLRITAQLINTADGSHIWSESYDRDLDDVFAIQDEISLAIVDHLKVKLLGEEKALMVKRPTEDPEVYNLYLKATYYASLATVEGIEKAIGYAGQALQKDPGFAAAYAGLGFINIIGSFIGNVPPNEGYPKAIEYTKRALEIDNTLAEAHVNLGAINMSYNWNWKLAEQELIQAIQLDPNSPWARNIYAWFLTFMDRNNEAIAEAEKAVELDPLNSYFNAELGEIYFYARKFDRAIEQQKWTITMYPDYYLGHYYLGLVYRAVSKMEEAVKEFKTAVKLSGGIPIVVSFLTGAYYEIGKKEEAEELMKNLEQRSEKEYVPAICFISYNLIKGDHDEAYKWLERAIDEHDTYLPANVAFPIKEYRIPNEPRYAALMEKVGLEKYHRND